MVISNFTESFHNAQVHIGREQYIVKKKKKKTYPRQMTYTDAPAIESFLMHQQDIYYVRTILCTL